MAYDKEDHFVEADGTKNFAKQADGQWKLGHSPASKEHHFEKGNSLGGRPKGSKNRKTLREELANKGGLTPAELLYSVMNDENANIGQRMKAAEKLMDFTEAKLSSIEVHTDEKHAAPFNIFLNTTPEEVKETEIEVCANCLCAEADCLCDEYGCSECGKLQEECECEGEE